MTHDHAQCRKLLSSLSDYVDGELEEIICTEIERHMEGCENCRIVVDTLRKTVYLYQETDQAPSVPTAVRRRLLHSLDLDEYISQ